MNVNIENNSEFDAWYKNLLTIHLAIVIGPALFTFVMIVLMDISKVQISALANRNIILLTAGLVVVSFLAAKYIYSEGIKKISRKDYSSGIYKKFQSISILRMAILEGAALISLILFFVYSDWTLLIYAILLIMYMILQIPHKRNVRRILNNK